MTFCFVCLFLLSSYHPLEPLPTSHLLYLFQNMERVRVFCVPLPTTEESFYTNNKRSSVTLSGLTEQDATSKRVCRGSIGVCLVKILRGWAGWALPCLSRQHWFRCLHMRSWSLIGSDWLAKALCYDIHHRHPQGRILSSPWNAITTCFTSSRRRLVGCLAAFRRFNRVLAWKGTPPVLSFDVRHRSCGLVVF